MLMENGGTLEQMENGDSREQGDALPIVALSGPKIRLGSAGGLATIRRGGSLWGSASGS